MRRSRRGVVSSSSCHPYLRQLSHRKLLTRLAFLASPESVGCCLRSYLRVLSKPTAARPRGVHLPRAMIRPLLFLSESCSNGNLLARCIVNHLGEAIDVLNKECAAAALDDPDFGQAVKLARHGLAMGADAACDLDMGGRRHDARNLALLGAEA